jgi:hypothetical protein
VMRFHSGFALLASPPVDIAAKMFTTRCPQSAKADISRAKPQQHHNPPMADGVRPGMPSIVRSDAVE